MKTKERTTLKKELALPESDFDKFVYIVSHDLQEPLRMVCSFLKLLDTKFGDELNDEAKSYINYSVENAEKMKHMIYAMVDLSRVGRSTEENEEIDMNILVQDILTMQIGNISKSNAIIEMDDLPNIEGQPSLVFKMIRNIISNAFENRREVQFKLAIESIITEDHNIIRIRDNGCGINDVYLESVFDMFKKVDQQSEHIGAGLSIAKAIAQKMNGDICIESETNVGTHVDILLPLIKE